MSICLFFSIIFFTQVLVTIQLSNNNSSVLVAVAQRIFSRQTQQEGVEFSYTNAHRWSERFPMCGGLAQSPINLTPFSCTKLTRPRDRLTFLNAYTPPRAVELINGDHTVRYVFHWNANATARITGGPLGTTAQYIPHEVHFHWTNGLFGGTEHSVYGVRFTMEMHIVCFNGKYRSLAEAMNFADGVLVLAQLYQKFLFSESHYFLQLLPYIRPRGSQLNITQSLDFFTLDQFLNVNRFNRYFVSYTGSLTTPPCREGIQWIVNVVPKKISFKTMRLFNRIQGMGGYIGDNVRPLQRTNGRACSSSNL